MSPPGRSLHVERAPLLNPTCQASSRTTSSSIPCDYSVPRPAVGAFTANLFAMFAGQYQQITSQTDVSAPACLPGCAAALGKA